MALWKKILTEVDLASLSNIGEIDSNRFIGNATASNATATVLTADQVRTIAGINLFNALRPSQWTGQTTIETTGTITLGTWGATTIERGYGGTGISAFTAGDIVVGTAPGAGNDALSKIAIASTANKFLKSAGAATNPVWANPTVAQLTGILPVTKGGLGAALTNVLNSVPISNGSTWVMKTSAEFRTLYGYAKSDHVHSGSYLAFSGNNTFVSSSLAMGGNGLRNFALDGTAPGSPSVGCMVMSGTNTVSVWL